MAWKWFWNTETKYYDEVITRETDWGGDASTENLPVSGGRVQEWLKTEINGRYGFLNMRFNEGESMYYIECFTNESDYLLYNSDKEANKDLLLQSVQIPISTVQGDAFTAMLRTNISNTADIVVTEGKLEVPLNYRAIKITRIGNENAGYNGSLVVQTSTNGETWNTTGTIQNVLPSSDPEDTNTYTTVDIGKYLVSGKQMVRLRATYTYTNEDGDKKTVNSSNVIIGGSVTKTSLSLKLRTDYEVPMQALDSNGAMKPFEVSYTVNGAVAKTLYVEIQGATDVFKTSQSLAETVDGVSETLSISEDKAYGILTHGVHKVTAWLEAEDGLGNTIKSETLVNRFMVVNKNTSGADQLKQYLMLQNVDSTATNYVQTELVEYAVYSPKQNEDGSITNEGEAVNVTFLLTNYAEMGVAPTTEYLRIETEVLPQTKNSLLTTIEIEAESEGESISHYDTYFRVKRVAGGVEYDFIKESTPKENDYYIKVDNKAQFTPIAGATFLLNPKVRNNSEDNPRRILNAKNKNAEVESVWTNFGFINDGWLMAEDGQKVLRVMAGSTLEIKMNVWKQFLSNPQSSLTFEFDFKVSNITNLTDPIINMSEGNASSFKGLRMNAMEGWLMTTSYNSKNDCLFAWQEGKRTHVIVNIHHSVKPNNGDVQYPSTVTNADGTIALARVLIDGKIEREIPFNVSNKNEWCSSDTGSIIIGNPDADIDIYSIRVYEDKQLEANELLNRNFLSSLPTAEGMNAVYTRNNILTGGKIDVEKVKTLGINCMIWHGALPYYYAQSEQNGWYEYFRFDENGKYLPEYSGTNCKETKSITVKGQGSTAKTYYDWNQQDDNSKVKATIQVAVKDFHDSITVSAPYTGDDGNQYVDIFGGNLGKNFPVENTPKAYLYSNGYVTVPDGWVDGNGKYRGMGYCVEEGTSLAQKKVAKINYASSMQSHLAGACKTYDLLHRIVVGDTPLQKQVPTAVGAKHIEPFMYFHQEENSNIVNFKGMCDYGAGKMDKVTWGYVKSLHPMFALIEGSDNNLPMTGFRVPFDKNTAVYSPKDEGYIYAGQQSWDFDGGATTDALSDGYITDGTTNDDGEVEVPKANIRDRWADIHNFVYLHGTNIKYYVGTFTQFKQSANVNDTNYKYWCTQGDGAYVLYRYDFIGKQWVDAGLWNGSSYNKIDLKTWDITASAYTDNVSSGNYATINEAFIAEIVAHMKKYLKYFFNEKSLLFNYSWVLTFLGGTDNSDKNTYYKIMPIAENMASDATTTDGVEFADWFKAEFGKDFKFSQVYQVYLDGDDMDSIFRTNNNSHQTKPYYIERMYPYADDNVSECLYEGMHNQLFNFVEKAYSGDNKLASVMNDVLRAATTLVKATDKIYGDIDEGNKVSVWGFLHKYFFNIQSYFPEVAYNEQARIRYEFPELIGFISQGGGARNIKPISQSLGSQLQNELQYMNQRLVYLASFAGFGAFGGMTGYSIGLPDANDTFSFTPAAMPDGTGSTYTFTVKTHQYFYPSYNVGTTFTNTHHRCKPNTAFTFTMAENVMTSDTGMGICGVNYYTDLGDFGNKSVTGQVIISGKRLIEVECSANKDNAFRPSSIEIKANNTKRLRLNVGLPVSTVDLTSLIRLSELYWGNTSIQSIVFPQSTTLVKIQINAPISKLSISGIPNLATLILSDTTAIEELAIGKNVGKNLNTQSIIELICNKQNANNERRLKVISVDNVNWTDFPAETLEWYCDIPTCEFKGTISIKEDDTTIPAITWDLKNKILAKFGNVDIAGYSNHKGLLLDYKKRYYNNDGTIIGNFYPEAGNEFQFAVKPSSTYTNIQYDIRWFANNLTEGSSIDNNGLLTVGTLPDTEHKATIYSTVFYLSETEGAKSHTLTKEIKLWNRPAQLGDLVYADGTYQAVADYDGEKTPIGVCFWIAQDDGKGTYVHPDDKQRRLMVALEDVTVTVGSTQESILQWGVYKGYANSSETEYKQGILFDTDATGNKVFLTSSVLRDIYDIETIQNIETSGLNNGSINTDGESDYRSNDDNAIIYNQGFKLVEANKAVGDGFGYGEISTFVNARTLDGELATLAGNGYNSGDIVNSAYAKTLKIIQHRNKLLNNDIYGADTTTPMINGKKFPIPVATSTKTELDALGELMKTIRDWSIDKREETSANANKWSQLAYPLASACYAYEPKKYWKDGEVLADKFKAHNWFAPSLGLLARICWYAKYGESQGVNVLSNAIAKGVLKFDTSRPYWSVVESNAFNSWCINLKNGSTYGNNKQLSLSGCAIAAF